MLEEMNKKFCMIIWKEKEIKWMVCFIRGRLGGLIMVWDSSNFEESFFLMGENW